MKIGEEHCHDDNLSIGRMRRLQADEHATCMCGGTWTGNGFARMTGNKLLEHLICTRCGYRWVADLRTVRAGFAVRE